MLQFERVSRGSTLEGWTPGLSLGVLFYAVAILSLYFFGSQLDHSLAPCFLLQVFGIECPLCGGTTASILLLSGKPIEAVLINPLVAISLVFSAIWVCLWLVFGIRLRFLGTDRTFVLVLLGLLMLNWVYVFLSHQ